MLTKITGNMLTAREHQASIAFKRQVSSLIRFTAAPLAIAGCVGISLPSTAITLPTTYRNDFRVCAGRLLRSGVASAAAATACAGSLRPNDLALCVERIERQTDIAAEDALGNCRQVRRPLELARCVVGISRNTQNQAVPGVLDYCGRSLLPIRFGECVVGLRREIELDPTQAMETCISASDRPLQFSPNFIPASQVPPLQPGSTPSVNPDLTPKVEPNLTPTTPQNQTPQAEPTTPAPTAPANPGGV